MFPRLLLVVALAAALAPSPALADAAADQYKVGAGHYTRERWELAIEEFRVFLRDYADHPLAGNATFFLGEALVQGNRYGEARDQFRQLLSRFPEHRYAAQALFRAGEVGYLLGEYPAARQDLEAFRQRHPEDALNAYVLPYLGEIALAEGRLAEARELFDAGLTRYASGPLQDDCRFGLARALEKLGDAERAERILLALSSKRTSPLAGDAQFHLAALLYARADYPAARQAFAEIETAFPESPYLDRAKLGCGWCEFQLGRYAEATAVFAPLVERPEVGVEAGYWLGLTHKARQDWQAAAENLEGMSVAPDHALAAAIVFHAGDALLRAGDAVAAAERFDRVLSEWPAGEWADDSLLARAQVALAAADHGRVDQLAARLEVEHRDSDQRAEVRRVLARSLIARQKHAEAIALLSPVVALEQPPVAMDQYLLAVAYRGAQRCDEALPLFDAVVATAPAELAHEARLAKAYALIAQSRHAEATTLLEECLPALTDGEAAARCRAQIAICHAQAGQIDKARAAYAELVAQHPAGEFVLPTTLHLAETVEAAGERGWAAELFASLSAEDNPAEYAAKGLLGLGWSHFQAGDFARTQETLDQLLARYPDDPHVAEAAVLRARALTESGKDADALAMYALAVDRLPADGELLSSALLGAAQLQSKAGNPAAAESLLARLAAEFPDDPRRDLVLYDRAWELLALDRGTEAEALFAEIRVDYPQSARWGDAAYRLAERAYKAQEYDRAAELLREIVAAESAAVLRPSALYMQGQIAAARKQWPDVATAMRAAVDAAPDGPLRKHAEFWIAEALYQQQQYAAALAALAPLAEQTDDGQQAWRPLVLLRQAQMLALAERWTEARGAAERALERYPDFEQRYELDYVVGRVHASRAEFDEARLAYRRAIRSPQGEGTEAAARAQFMIGETFFHQKDYATALREFLRVEILYDYPTWQAASLLEAAKCHEQLEQWKAAVELYDRMLADFPETELRDEAARRLQAAQERLAAAR